MIKLTDDGSKKFLTKWNSCVKKSNRIDNKLYIHNKAQVDHIVECAYIVVRRSVTHEIDDRVFDAQNRNDKEELEKLKSLSIDDRAEMRIEKNGLTIKLNSCITINYVEYSFKVPRSWLDFG